MERTKSFKYRQLTSCKCFKMRKASRLTTQFYDKKLKSVGIRITQFTILSFIATTENKTLISLSEELSMDRTTLTRGLNILLKDGLIKQIKAKDSRKKVMAQKGRASFSTIASHCAFLQGNALLSCCILLGQVITQSQTSLNVVIYLYLSGWL